MSFTGDAGLLVVGIYSVINIKKMEGTLIDDGSTLQYLTCYLIDLIIDNRKMHIIQTKT